MVRAEEGSPGDVGVDFVVAGTAVVGDRSTGSTMKVGIAKEGNLVSPHFGHCEGYAIYSIEDGTITRRFDLKNPGHQPGVLPALLAGEGVTLVIAGGMGPQAIELFQAQGIEVCIGITGEIDAVIQSYLQGDLSSGQSSCHHMDH